MSARENDRKPWSEEDEATLRRLWAEPLMTIEDVAVAMKRSRPSIAMRATKWLKLGRKVSDRPAIYMKKHNTPTAEIEKLWAEGMSAREIGERLNRHYNHIYRVAKALNLPRRVKVKADPPPRAKPTTPRTVRLATRQAAPVDVSNAKTLMFREFGECCFPVAGEGADTLYCCAVAETDKPYCPGHARRMYAPPQPKKERPYQPRRAA